ncbi:hypothetical protein T440DRAFT_465367 [Plenodomus tracheiphilus IPT5]|uniref:DUF6590 domain-containing protein n=1 Tax=Plenodomus tracheiphilus IPT5 TaxID=1408161 RepID=A0A6A7BG69_9PLEO|nr:hypothetical protein T440DRAFT_465367 [Plenodomus tracheiphilus IPT5]
MARFIVIRTKRTHCLCLRISTYSGQATTKPGIAAADHVPVVPVGEYPVNHPSGEQPMEGFVSVKVEANDVTISPMSRINFAKIYTIEHNIRVRNIGRVDKSSMGRLEGLFSQSLSIVK